MRTIKDGRCRVHVFHGYNKELEFFYGSHTIIYRRPREQNGVLGVVYSGEFFPFHAHETNAKDAVIIYDVHARTQKVREQAEADRRAALTPEERDKEDHERRSRVIQMIWSIPRAELERQLRAHLSLRHTNRPYLGRKSANEPCHTGVKFLKAWDDVHRMPPEILRKYGVDV